MRRYVLLMAILLPVGSAMPACGGAPAAPEESLPPPGPLAEFEWMVGSWRLTEGATTSEEHWLPPAGDLMVGVNRTIEAGETVAFEYVRLEADGEAVFYMAMPGGGAATSFAHVGPLESHPHSAVFFNPDHDFPRRISYWREGDTLFARIDSGAPGTPAASDAVTWSWSAAAPAFSP